MTACLAEFRCFSRAAAAGNRPAELQVASSGSSAFQGAAAPPDTCRASGVSEFFSNIKSLFDRALTVLEAAGDGIGRLIDWMSSAPDKEKVGSETVNRPSAVCSVSEAAQQDPRPAIVGQASQSTEVHPASGCTEASPGFGIGDGQINELQSVWQHTLFDPISDKALAEFLASKIVFLQSEDIQPTPMLSRQDVGNAHRSAMPKSRRKIGNGLTQS